MAARAVKELPTTTLMGVPEIPMLAPSPVVISDRSNACTSEEASRMFPPASNERFVPMLTVPRLMASASVKNASWVVSVTVRLPTLRLRASAAFTPSFLAFRMVRAPPLTVTEPLPLFRSLMSSLAVTSSSIAPVPASIDVIRIASASVM